MSKQNNFSSFKNKDSKTINKSFKPKTVIKKESTKKNNYKNIDNNIPIHESINPYIKNYNNNKINKKLESIKEESEEERIKRELEEKEKEKIRDKLECSICCGKVVDALMCVKCKHFACEKCVKKLQKKNICFYCKEKVNNNDIIKLPFMNDLTSFFINNLEKKSSLKKSIRDKKKIGINKNNSDNTLNSIIIVNCKKHQNRKIEYYCTNCKEYLCSECIVFFNKENVERHKSHIILAIEDINEFDLYKIIKEYEELSSRNTNIENISQQYNVNIREIEIRKKRSKEILKKIRDKLESNYLSRINDIKALLTHLKSKKNDIERGKNEFSKHYNEYLESNYNIDKKNKIINDLSDLNNIHADQKVIEEKSIFKKNICCESYETDFIEFIMPNNGAYIEECEILNMDLDLIPDTACKINAKLLTDNIIFTLIIPVEQDFYKNNSPSFFSDFLIISKNQCEYALFDNYYYNEREQVLAVQFEFTKMKSLLDENNKCLLKFNITRNYYK